MAKMIVAATDDIWIAKSGPPLRGYTTDAEPPAGQFPDQAFQIRGPFLQPEAKVLFDLIPLALWHVDFLGESGDDALAVFAVHASSVSGNPQFVKGRQDGYGGPPVR